MPDINRFYLNIGIVRRCINIFPMFPGIGFDQFGTLQIGTSFPVNDLSVLGHTFFPILTIGRIIELLLKLEHL